MKVYRLTLNISAACALGERGLVRASWLRRSSSPWAPTIGQGWSSKTGSCAVNKALYPLFAILGMVHHLNRIECVCHSYPAQDKARYRTSWELLLNQN